MALKAQATREELDKLKMLCASKDIIKLKETTSGMK